MLVSGVMGFIGPSFITNIVRGKAGSAGLTHVQNAYLYFTRSVPVGFAMKKAAPDARAADLGDDGRDECSDLKLSGVVSEILQ